MKNALWITVIAISVRITIFLSLYRSQGLAGFMSPDTQSYVTPAENMIQHHGFKTTLANGSLYWETIRTPAYPAVIYGAKAISLHGWAYLLIAGQMAVDGLLVVLIMFLTKERAGGRAAAMAGLAYAISPAAAIYATKLLSETLFSSLSFCAVCIPLVMIGSRGRVTDSYLCLAGCLSGTLFGLASLTRPLGYYVFGFFLLLMMIASIANSWKRSAKRHFTIMWFCAFSVYLAITGGWIVRNGVRTDYWSISSIDYVNLLFFRAAAAEAAQDRVKIEAVYDTYRKKYKLEEAPVWDESPEGLRKGKQMKGDALTIIANHKLGYLKVASAGAVRLMFGPNRYELRMIFGERPGEWVSRLVAGVLVLIWVVAAVGYLSHRGLWPLVVLGCCLVGVSAGFEAYARFRVVLEPLLAVGFGLGLDYGWNQYLKRFFVKVQSS